MATAATQKSLGAFYTAEPIARFIARWAVRASSDLVLDPSCGEGVFLGAGVSRLRELGSARPVVWGIELDGEAIDSSRALFPGSRLLRLDFFCARPEDFPQFDAVVGNPPFIRYQNFSGDARSLALSRAKDGGVHLPRLSSSWAPFLVHAVAFLRSGGRLAMVVPAEWGMPNMAIKLYRS